jgi:alpha-L-rhamnosidase
MRLTAHGSLCLAVLIALPGALQADGLVGPIETPRMKTLVNAEGAQAIGYHFEKPAAKPAPWLAKWIWVNGQAPDRGWFRKEVDLSSAPTRAIAWLTADKKYRLWINGRLVSRGPADQGRDYQGGSTGRWFYDIRDLTPFFQAGRNFIAVEVFRNWPGGSVVSRSQGLLFEAQLDSLTVKSDASWRAVSAKEEHNWQLPEFDDSRWPAAEEVKDVWSPLVASEIPPLMEVRWPVVRCEGLPANKTFTRDGRFRVVFDRALSGIPQLTVRGGRGATVTIKATRHAEFKLGGGKESLESFMDALEPAFTVELTNVREPLEVLDCGAVVTTQPVEYRGDFSCSDERLNRIWKASRWAVQICLQTHHLDSPHHQEPICDPGDYVIEAMVNHYAFAQPWLARQDIRKFAWVLKSENYRNFHTSYSIAWLQMLMDYCDYTGDQSLVKEMSPYVHELLAAYTSWRGANGLISEAPNYMFMDWVTIGGFACHHPPAVIGQGYLTALYYHGLEMASRVAVMTGEPNRVEEYRKLRGEVRAAFNRELWVPGQGLYRDGKPFQTSVKPYTWMPADKPIETFSPHVNLLAVLYDLAPKDAQQAIVERVLADKPLNTQPWFMHWGFASFDHAGLFNRFGAEQLRRWKIVPETQTFREMWNGGDLSHGWCSTPLVQMSARILGVAPAEPGFETISLAPCPCDLSWAKGKVPTPHGDVAVSWTRDENRFTLDLTIPPGTRATATLPLSGFDHPSILADGKESRQPLRLEAGTHHVEVQAAKAAEKTADHPPIKVLIVDGFSNHDWARTTALIRAILAPTGRFLVDVATCPAKPADPAFATFRPRFADYDVVIANCNNLGNAGQWPAPMREDFVKFVRAGGGLFVFHSANNAFADWPEYDRIIGLGWRGKNAGTAITIDPDGAIRRIPTGEGRGTSHGARSDRLVHRLGEHPIHAGLPRQWTAAMIEVYTYARGPAENLDVLSWAEDPATKSRWPIEWTVSFGNGRVYNSTFGHVWRGESDPIGIRCAGFQTILVRAMQWLAKRPVDFPIPADFPGEAKSVLRPLPGPSAEIKLKAVDAGLSGGANYYADGDFVGSWTDPDARLQWEITLDEPISAKFALEQSCAPGCGGNFVLSIGRQQLSGETRSTGGWYNYKVMDLGEVKLAKGRHIVTLQAGPFRHAAMNFKSISLSPAKGSAKTYAPPPPEVTLPATFVVPNFHPASSGWLANWSVERNYCNWEKAQVARRAWEYNCPVRVVTDCARGGQSRSFFTTSDNLIVEVVRREGDEIEMRLVECLARVTIDLPHESAALTDLIGGNRQMLGEGPTYSFPVHPQQIVTMRLKTKEAVAAIRPLMDWTPLVPPQKRPALHQYLKTAIGHPPRGRGGSCAISIRKQERVARKPRQKREES